MTSFRTIVSNCMVFGMLLGLQAACEPADTQPKSIVVRKLIDDRRPMDWADAPLSAELLFDPDLFPYYEASDDSPGVNIRITYPNSENCASIGVAGKSTNNGIAYPPLFRPNTSRNLIRYAEETVAFRWRSNQVSHVAQSETEIDALLAVMDRQGGRTQMQFAEYDDVETFLYSFGSAGQMAAICPNDNKLCTTYVNLTGVGIIGHVTGSWRRNAEAIECYLGSVLTFQKKVMP